MPKKASKTQNKKVDKFVNKYFRRRLVFIVIACIIVILAIIGINKKIKAWNYRLSTLEYETRIFGETQEKSAEVTKFFTYGTYLQLEGTLQGISKDNFENVKLVVVSEDSEQEYEIEGSILENNLQFSSTNLINSGINLDKLAVGTYYIKLRVKLNNSTTPKYYTLVNTSEYPDIEYYTVTKNGKNNKIDINFTKFQRLEEADLNCLKLSVSESTLPDNVYDIVVDAGHGGKDKGVTTGGYEEKNITLDVAKYLKTELEAKGYKVKMTRDDENTDTYTATNMYDKNGRISIACESNAKLMISLHVNDGSSKLSGLEVYAPCKSDLSLARKISNKLIEQTYIEFSNSTSYKETDGVYVKNYTNSMIKEMEQTASKKNFAMYDITTDTPYLYTIREVGGIATGAYVDGRNTAYAKNEYYNSNKGIECYQIEMGYIDTDLQKIVEEEEDYAYAIADAISEFWNEQ
jgi:N-acetylmuramoyl-L-alanine amidase